jgi:RNA polymerase sigma factor (sigma-70 family)
VPVHDELDAAEEPSFTVLAVHAALDRFAKLDPERSRVVELRYFGGFELEEIADLLQVSRSTVKRHWAVARLWLQRELGDAAGPSGGAIPRNPDGEQP